MVFGKGFSRCSVVEYYLSLGKKNMVVVVAPTQWLFVNSPFTGNGHASPIVSWSHTGHLVVNWLDLCADRTQMDGVFRSVPLRLVNRTLVLCLLFDNPLETEM